MTAKKTPRNGGKHPAPPPQPPPASPRLRPKAALSIRRRAFISAYLGPAAGNGALAARMAGYAAASSHVTGAQLLAIPSIRDAVEKAVASRQRRINLTAEERDTLAAGFALNPTLAVRDRIKALDMLNKCAGRYSMKHAIAWRLTLEQVLSQSREGDE